MKPGRLRTVAVSFAALIPALASAQSSVTIYGVVDTGVEYVNNVGASKDSPVSRARPQGYGTFALGDARHRRSRWWTKRAFSYLSLGFHRIPVFPTRAVACWPASAPAFVGVLLTHQGIATVFLMLLPQAWLD